MAQERHRKPGRLDFIEGMRGVAAFYVMLTHVVGMIDPYASVGKSVFGRGLVSLLLSPFRQGPIAVAAFIVISGYCLQIALFNRGDGRLHSMLDFMKRRCRRILPPHYACLALSIVVALTVTTWMFNRTGGKLPWSTYLPVTWDNTLAHALMYNNFSSLWRYKINGVLWSIAIEFQLYFLFPLFVWSLWKLGRNMTLLAATLVIYPFVLLFPEVVGQYHIWFLTLFVLGIVSAHYAVHKNPTHRMKVGATLVAIFGGIGAAYACATKEHICVQDTYAGLAVASMLVLGTWSSKSWVTQFFSLKGIVWVGAFSYSLYLMHHPFMQVMYYFKPAWFSTPNKQLVYLFVIGVPIITIACWLFYRVFEKPFITRPPKLVEQPEAEPKKQPVGVA